MTDLDRVLQWLRRVFSFCIGDEYIRIGRVAGTIFQKEFLTQKELNHHVHILGASGFGKTVLIKKIMIDQIKKGKGCLFLDLKGDRSAINEMIADIALAGRLNDLKIFSISHLDLSGNYNLFKSGNATELRDRLMGALVWSEEFYKVQAFAYLLKLFIVLCWLRDSDGRQFDLKDIYLGCSDENYLRDLCLQVNNNSLDVKILAEDCYRYVTTDATAKCLNSLRAQLESLMLASFGEKLKEDASGIDLFEAVNSDKIIFIFLDTRRYKEASKAIGKMIIRDIIATSARVDDEIPKEKRRPFVCFVDEFADLADEDFTAFPDRARSSKMSLVLSHQELADLDKVSETFSARMTANMATLYSFLESNADSAERIAKRAGTMTVSKTTARAKRFLFWHNPTGDYSLREVEEYVIHPNRIKSLRVGEVVVVKKYPYSRAFVVNVDLD